MELSRLERTPDVLIVDSKFLATQSFFSFPELAAADGTRTGAIHGFFSAVANAIRDLSPRLVFIAAEGEGYSRRRGLHSAYKANRPPTDSSLLKQLGMIYSLAALAGWPVLSQSGEEADDVIATLTRMARESGYTSCVYSPDKDLLSLVADDCHVYRRKGGVTQLLSAVEVEEEFGVSPNQMADLLSLAGDSSDNIPGIAGIGVKIAAALLKQFGTADAMFSNAAAIESDSIRGKVLNGRSNFDLSRDLVRLNFDVKVPWSHFDQRAPADHPAFTTNLEALGLRSVLRRLPDLSLTP